MVGAFVLNPVCVLIFLAGSLLETLYCLLWRVSPYRAVVNGIVKSSGAVAAVFAVNSQPSYLFLLVLGSWIFFWEIGGQNIPNDWADLEQDRRFKARTIPVCLGTVRAGILLNVSLVFTLLFSQLLLLVSALSLPIVYYLASIGIAIWLLFIPALKIESSLPGEQQTSLMNLFNTASYYPMALLGLVLVRMIYRL